MCAMELIKYTTWTVFVLTAIMLFALSTTALSFDAPQPIKVGVTVSLTGSYDIPGKSLINGISMWADDINARGALLGREVEIIYYDDQSDPETSASLYEQLIINDKVDLLIGPYASNLTFAAAAVAEKYGFPMVSGTAAATAIWNQGYRNIFQVDVPAPDYMKGLLHIAKKKDYKKVGILYQDSIFTEEVAMGAKSAAEKMDMEITVFISYENSTTDFSSMVKELADSGTDLLLGATYFDDSIEIVKECKRQNYSPRSMAFTGGPSNKEFGVILGPDAEGLMGVTSWIDASREPMAYDFDFRYRYIYGIGADSNAAGGYSAGEVLEAAVRLAGTLNKEAVRQQLYEMSFLSIMGRYKVDETGKQIGKAMYLIQWQNERRRLILPQKIAEKKPIPFTPWDQR
jgi:branched-chain amino acid transport system substrate-binding protein